MLFIIQSPYFMLETEVGDGTHNKKQPKPQFYIVKRGVDFGKSHCF